MVVLYGFDFGVCLILELIFDFVLWCCFFFMFLKRFFILFIIFSFFGFVWGVVLIKFGFFGFNFCLGCFVWLFDVGIVFEGVGWFNFLFLLELCLLKLMILVVVMFRFFVVFNFMSLINMNKFF